MNFIAHIDIMPLKALLDPQGKAVTGGLKNIGLSSVNDVRIGKHMSLNISASNSDEAYKIAEEACKKLLCNLIMEGYEIKITNQ